ncbi:MAG: phosphopentomutase [Endomicrobium sp.]|jgi:phosphopentomutase|nr:phosphopentomutase [Endomicrobium sp.]
MSKRAILIVLDGVGAGALPDAAQYCDEGANTLGHIFEKMGAGFALPNLEKLGLYKVLNKFTSDSFAEIEGCYGKAATKSPAKDTTAGHWEMAGIVLDKPFATYPLGFPKELIERYENSIDVKVIGNKAASGTEIIKELGDEHIKTGFPIVYTSADSVFQVAAHEETFGLNRLYEICQIARKMLSGENAVGRVIARPFTGKSGNYTRTPNRKDYSLTPFYDTVLDEIKNSGGEVIAIGKIEDIYNAKGITQSAHTKGNVSGMRAVFEEIKKPFSKNTLIFTNLVDFDMLWGHRRDSASYAKGLKDFDDFLSELINALTADDLLIITADHGCDPTFAKHTDHTREYVPLLAYGKNLKKNIDLGIRESLSDIGQTLAEFFGLPKLKNGKSFLTAIING